MRSPPSALRLRLDLEWMLRIMITCQLRRTTIALERRLGAPAIDDLRTCRVHQFAARRPSASYQSRQRVIVEIREQSWLKGTPKDIMDQRTCVVMKLRGDLICDMRDYTDAHLYEEFRRRHPELPKFKNVLGSPQRVQAARNATRCLEGEGNSALLIDIRIQRDLTIDLGDL